MSLARYRNGSEQPEKICRNEVEKYMRSVVESDTSLEVSVSNETVVKTF